ncbi:MAG: hypothetical protein U5O16_20305 [Rhodococcus sp. (in: high G+C Gram-positive bacteria)]|uniref:hypothetical protein n=1 Tax=Rhodococcus sp. TaxID=1831 RepID=UPI002AD6A3F8|nr:hypothetical protein [Rhodococcus sp. (in: high G+C Gram-positive bacteria)]
MKYLRDYKNTFSAKSVILTILLGNRVNSAALLRDPDSYKDTPTALKTIVGELNSYLQDNEIMPPIEDPACPGETYNHRWEQDQYANFRKQIQRYNDKINEAYDPNLSRDEASKNGAIFSVMILEPTGKMQPRQQMHRSATHETLSSSLIPT